MRSIQIVTPSCTRNGYDDQSLPRSIRRLPHWFPREAAGMTTANFDQTYAPDGQIALHTLSVEPTRGDTVTCRARITLGKRSHDVSATAVGTIGAMVEMLYALGAGVEIVSLSQEQIGDDVVTYLRCERNERQCVSYGRGRTGDEAVVNALIAGANQLSA